MKEDNKVKNKEKPAETEKKDFLEDFQRVQADFENYIKRIEKEKEQLKLHAKSELLLKFISVKEDLERALKDVDDVGLNMVHNKIKKILDEEGVKEIKAVGEDFDHILHEAVKITNGAENKILEEIQKGYLLNDKILRASKVILGNGEIKIDGEEDG